MAGTHQRSWRGFATAIAGRDRNSVSSIDVQATSRPAAHEPDKLKVFISYSRRDAIAADVLAEALIARGFEVTIDRRDLPFGEKWQTELAEFIRLSDTVIWLVSDASIRSKWVNWELDEVAKKNKRLVPVMVGDSARDALPRQLGEIHILPAEGVFAPERDLDALVRVLETDRAWLKHASRLQDRATEWISNGRTSALLLSRGALSDAERWTEARPAKAPAPAQEILDLLLASRQAATRRLRWWVAGSLAVAAGAIGLSILAYFQSVEAARQRDVAQKQARSSTLFSSALQHEGQDPTFGFRLLGHARTAFPSTTIATAGTDWYRSKQFYKLALSHDGAEAVLFLPPANGLVSASEKSVKAWTLDGTVKWETAASLPIAISPDGKQLVALSERYGGTVKTIDAETGKPLADLPQLRGGTPIAIKFSRDGRRLAIGYTDGTLKILDWKAGSVQSIAAHKQKGREHRGVTSIDFSPDGQLLVTGGDDNLIRIWDANGQPVRTLTGHQGYVEDIAFSPDAKLILSRGMDQTTRLWSPEGVQVGQVRSYATYGRTAMFANSRHAFLSALEPNTLVLWDNGGKALQQFTAPGAIVGIDRSADGESVVTLHRPAAEIPRGEGTIRLWRLKGLSSFSRADGGDCVNTIGLSGDARIVVVGPRGNCIFRDGSSHLVGYPGGYIRILDRRAGTELKVDAVGHDRMVAISQDGGLMGACGRKVVFLRSDGTPLRSFDNAECPIAIGPTSRHALMATKTGAVVWEVEKDEVRALDTVISKALFSPRGDSVLVLTKKGRVEHWSLDGTAIAVPETGQPVRQIGFSTDGSEALALDTMLRSWPVDAPAKVRSIHIGAEHPSRMLSLPKRNVIVTSGFDKIDVWTREGQLVGSYETLDNAILAVVPAHHGNSVLAATSVQTVMDVFVPSPLPDFEKSTELAEFSALRYALAGVDDQYQRLLASKDRDGSISSFHEFADRAWALGDPELLQKALKLGEQAIGQRKDIPSVAEVLAIASELELKSEFDQIMGALEPRQLLEIVELLDRKGGRDLASRRAQAYKQISEVIESTAARQNLPEFEPRRARARQKPLLRDARRFQDEAGEAATGRQYDRANGLYQKAIDTYRAAIAAGPARPAQARTDPDSSAETRTSLVEILMSKGYANFRNKKYADAKRDWEEAAALAPGDSRAYSNMGFVEFEMGNFAKAVASFDKAIGLDRQNGTADALCGKAIALHELGQRDESRQWYAKCIAVSDEYASADSLAGHGWSDGQIEIARRILSQLRK